MEVAKKLVELIGSFNSIKSSVKNREFLLELSKIASEILDVDYVLIGKGTRSNSAIQTDVVVGREGVLENFDYDLKDTPCDNVFTGARTCTFPENVDKEFPKDILLSQLNIQSYVGANLYLGDEFFGLFILLKAKPLSKEEECLLVAACEFLAMRTSLEYRSMKTEENFRASEEFLNRILRDREHDLHQSHDDLKVINKELSELVHDKHNLLSTILHDISNPLMAATTNLSLSPSIESDTYIQNAEDALSEVIRITGKIRKAYKDGVNQKSSTPKDEEKDEISLGELVKYASLVFQDKLDKKNLDLVICKGGELSFCTDSTSFKNSVFNNLISNAIKFSPPNSVIEVGAKIVGNKLELEIRDHGEGIPPKVIDQINKGAFVVESNLGTLGEEGTGLGIRSAIDYVKDLGGSIRFRNVDEEGGRGTNICISLN